MALDGLRADDEEVGDPVWLLLVVAPAVLGAGLVLAHGLLIAAGLVLAGMAGELFDSFPPDR
ncbi:hypothetical protein AB0R06_31380 [Streptomyces chartreusis]